MPGRSTLTATSRAVGRDGEMHLRDRGGGDRGVVELREQRLERLAELALDRARAPRAPGNAGRRSCSCARSAATSSLRRSARVDSAWPSLMKLGPHLLQRRRQPLARPPRVAAQANSRAQAISGGAMPRISSGNSASWRAKLSATRNRRQLLRSARQNILDPPARMQGGDAEGHVAPGDLLEARRAHARASSLCGGKRRMLSCR